MKKLIIIAIVIFSLLLISCTQNTPYSDCYTTCYQKEMCGNKSMCVIMNIPFEIQDKCRVNCVKELNLEKTL